jgi:hypothetical protein
MHVVRDISKADDDQLTAIRESATRLLDELEQFMGGDLVEALCLWREAAQKNAGPPHQGVGVRRFGAPAPAEEGQLGRGRCQQGVVAGLVGSRVHVRRRAGQVHRGAP